MRYELMFPDQHQAAKDKNVPLVIPIGNLEYHGQHSVCGTDILITQGICERLEQQQDIVLAPAFSYAPSSYAASGPEQGTMHLSMQVFQQYISGMLIAFLEGGWNNIYVLIHHQYDMEMPFPLTLACMMAGKQAFFDRKEQLSGRGWFARAQDLGQVIGEMNAVKVLPIMSREVQMEMGYDHAGKIECSLLAALRPDMQLVKPERAPAGEWFAQTVSEYSREYGEQLIERCLADLKGKIV